MKAAIWVTLWFALGSARSEELRGDSDDSKSKSESPIRKSQSDSPIPIERPPNPSDDFPYPQDYQYSRDNRYGPYHHPYLQPWNGYHYLPPYPGYPQPPGNYYPPPFPEYPEQPIYSPPFIHEPNPTSTGYRPYDTPDTGCEWKMIFKAVAGNGRNIYADYYHYGDINKNSGTAKDLVSPLVFRDGDILDQWDHLLITKVKLELYVGLLRGVWFMFNGERTRFNTWFQRDGLIASPFRDLKTGDFPFFSIDGDEIEDRRFLIARTSDTCSADCFYMAVVEEHESPSCRWEQATPFPIFAYGRLVESCSHFDVPGEIQYADRLVISAKVCDIGHLHE